MEYVDLSPFYLALHPRPVVMVVTSYEDRVNVMPASWNTPISEQPPTVGVAIERGTYTRELLGKNPEFTLNLVSVDLVGKVLEAGRVSGRNVDKVSSLGLKLERARVVRTPILSDAIAVVEARVLKSIEVGEVDFIVGEVLASYARSDLLYRGSWNLRKARILMHVKGRAFTYPEQLVLG